MHEITNAYSFSIEVFDVKAAVEVALLTDSDLLSGNKLSETETKAKVKYDRQIVAIAKVNGAETIYSDDKKLATLAKRNGIKTVKVAELPLPPEDDQQDFFENGEE